MLKENMLSLEAIQKKFSLPAVLNKIIDVQVPAGTKMRVGEAGAKSNFPNKPKGGGRQFELEDDIPNNSFDEKTIKDL